MATLHYDRLVPTIFESTTSQAGYPATNLGNESLARPWKGVGVGVEDLTLRLPAAATIQTVFLDDVNFDSCTVKRSANGVDFVDVGVATAYPNEHGRYRGKITVGVAGLVAIRLAIAAGAANDGLADWRGGAVYLFGSSAPIPVGPSYNYRTRTKRPRISAELANGLVAQARTGLNIDRIDFPYERKFDKSLRLLKMKAEQGTVLLSMDIPDWPDQMWPVRYLDDASEEAFPKVHKAQGSLVLTEVV